MPFLLGILFEKKVKWKKKVVDFVPMFAILLLGVGVVCWYNYARFDSIMEFGQSYQLSVTDQRNLTYSLAKLYPTSLHFYVQKGKTYDVFPFISCVYKRYEFETWELAPYVSSFIGALWTPLFWLTFLTPILCVKDKRVAPKALGIIFPFFLFIFAFTTYSKAGICPRYLIEFNHLATLGAFFALLKMGELSKGGWKENAFACLAYIILVPSVILCLSLSFDSFDGMKEGSCFGLFLKFKEVFLAYNF